MFTRLRAMLGSVPLTPQMAVINAVDGAAFQLRIAPHLADPILPETKLDRERAKIDFLVTLEPATPRPGPLDLIQRSFGLSRAEAMAAFALAEGQSATDQAESRGVSVHTIRNQIKSAMIKMGVHRQTDMAVLISRMLASGSKS